MTIKEAKIFKVKAKENAEKYLKEDSPNDYINELLLINSLNNIINS